MSMPVGKRKKFNAGIMLNVLLSYYAQNYADT